MGVITCQLLDMLNIQIKNYHCICKKILGKYISANSDVVLHKMVQQYDTMVS